MKLKRFLLFFLICLIFTWYVPLQAHDEDSTSKATPEYKTWLKLDLVKGVYIGGHFKDARSKLDTRKFALEAGYIIKISDNFLGAVDLNWDPELGIAGVGPTILVPINPRIWFIGGAEILNFVVNEEGITDNNTASLKFGFVALLSDKPIWRNVYAAFAARYFYRTAVNIGDEALTETVNVTKENFNENGLRIGFYFYFD